MMKSGKAAFIFLLVFSGLVILSFDSCKSRKPVQTEPTGCKAGILLPRALIAEMRSNEFQFEWFSARLACEASSDSAHVGFDVILRMRRDSMIWMLVTDPLMGIKVARVLITKDSVKFVQYGLLGAPDRCFSGDFAYLSLLLQTDVDFEMMQSLLIGNSAEFYEEDEKLKSSLNRASCTYTLGTIRKRRLRKIIGGQRQVEDPVQTITLDPSSFKILNILFLDAQNRTFTATYSNFKTLDSMLVPAHAVFYARGLHKNATLDASYKHISLSGPLEFPFVFPDDCETILIPQRGENNKQPAPGH